MSKNYCVFKVSPSGIQKPLYYGSEEDCRRFCETKDYEFIDEENVVWYLEIDSRPTESRDLLGQKNEIVMGQKNETAIRQENETAVMQEQQNLAGAGII